MKTLRLIGVALFTVLMSVNLTACGGDDKDEPSGGGNPLVGTWVEKVTDDSFRVPTGSQKRDALTSIPFLCSQAPSWFPYSYLECRGDDLDLI